MAVFPVYSNAFKVGATIGTATAIADMETFSLSIDNGVEEWNPMEAEGWVRRLLTSKSMTIGINGKRNTSDAGNNYIAGLAWVSGSAAAGVLEWTLPGGSKIPMECVFNVSTLGGDSTAGDALEFEALSNGKPTFTPAP